MPDAVWKFDWEGNEMSEPNYLNPHGLAQPRYVPTPAEQDGEANKMVDKMNNETDAKATTCVSCGAATNGPYCGECGGRKGRQAMADMTREEAARELDNTACCFSDKRFRNAMHMAAAALRGPVPDHITGLVPCGCGCNPELRADDGGWYQVYCTGCDMHGGYSHTPNNVIEEWNEAMGYKGGAE